MTYDPNVPEIPSTLQAEASWEEFVDGTLPDTSHTQRFQQAVTKAAEELFTRPGISVNHERLQKAMDLALSGAIEAHGDGTFTVKSGTHRYQVAGECTCADSQHRSKYCKHYLATLLWKAAQLQLHGSNDTGHPDTENATTGHAEPSEPSQPPVKSPQAWQCAQAPSSCTLKWNFNGIEMLLTLRAGDDQQLFNRIGRVLPRIEEKLESQRLQREQANQEREQRQAEQQQVQQTQGHGGNGGSNTSPITTSLPDDDEGWCNRHQSPMYRHEKNGDVWYSHRTDDSTWCRGKK